MMHFNNSFMEERKIALPYMVLIHILQKKIFHFTGYKRISKHEEFPFLIRKFHDTYSFQKRVMPIKYTRLPTKACKKFVVNGTVIKSKLHIIRHEYDKFVTRFAKLPHSCL